MKVLFITQKADRGDPVLGFMHAWFEGLAARLEELHLLVLEPGDHALPDNVFVHSMGKERGAGRAVKTLNFARIMNKLVLTRKVDVVFAHMCPVYAVLAAPYCHLRNMPLLLWLTHGADNAMVRLSYQAVDKVLTASPESTALRGPKVVPTGHGIDTNVFAPAPCASSDVLTVLSVGRVSPVKDYPVLLRATGMVRRQKNVPDFEVSIVGACYSDSDREHKKELETMLEREGIADMVHFRGATQHHEMPGWYNGADLFVSTSLTGSIDKAVLEAMACECAAITCNTSFERVFGNLADDLMFPAGDAEALAARMTRFLSLTADERADLAKRLRNIVCSDHSLDALMDRLVHEMQLCIDTRK